jgi:hypothetical protein
MGEVIDAKLEFAKKLVNYLGAQNLPRTLMDDKRLRIDSDTRTEDELLLAHFNEDSLHSIKTVRFLKDFYNYKAAPDLKTGNTSFLRTAEVFRQQGIKNYYFLLQLNNRMLQGVDPHADDLTNEQKLMIAEECRTNFWYFLREVCMLKPDQSFMANRGNISFIWNYLNHITTYMIMPRQQGKMQPNRSLVRVKCEKSGNLVFKDVWKKIGEVRTGDVLIAPNGKTSTVIGVHPQGKLRMYTLTFSDGRTTEAGAEHLWTLKDYSRGTSSRRGITDDYTTADLITGLAQGHAYEAPLIKAEKGREQKFTLDPYLFGWMVNAGLVEGNLQGRSLSKEQDAYLEEVLPQTLMTSKDKKLRTVKRRDGNAFNFDLSVGLPQHYLEGALEDRLKLVQAFFDEGLKIGKTLTLKAPNELIANQLAYVIRGLGGTARPIRDTLTVTLPKELAYFRFRKDKQPEVDNRLWLESIAFSGDDEATCIEVDSQDHLYITDDFIVTHNTVSVQVINFWLTYINGRGYKSHLITLKNDNRAQFIDAVKKIRTCMPSYLVNPTWRDKDSGNYLTYKAFGEEYTNSLNINVPQMGRDAAGDLGRGLTVETTTYDEPAYISFIEEIINGCAPSALTAMANARIQGKPYGISFITTPNTTLHPSGKFMFEKLMNSTEWREKFFDSFSESHLKERLLRASPKETTAPSVAMVYNYMQLGKDKDWVKETIDSLNLSLSKAKIDLLLMWVEDGENRLFDDVTREAINNCKNQVVWSKEYVSSGLFMDFFVTQQQLIEMGRKDYNDYFLIGVDTSSAINKDACTIIIRSMKTGKVVGVGRYPLAFLDDVTSIIVDLLGVLNNSLLVIERNYAHHMIDNLLIMLPAKGMDPFTRIYNQIYQDTVSHEKEFKEVQNTKFAYRQKNFYLKFKQYFGFNTTSRSRETLYGLIQEAVANTGYGINYDKLADELINLRTKGGRIDHDTKMHDDLVISWLLTYWFIKLGMNKSLYGISAGIALTDTKNIMNQANGRQQAELEPHVAQFLNKVKARAQQLTEELLQTNDNLLAVRLEAEIRKLTRVLPPEAARFMTIDVLLEEAKIERNKRMLIARNNALAA